MGGPEGEQRQKGEEKIFEETVAKTSQIYPRNARVFQHKKIHVIYLINRIIISVDTEKAFDIIHYPLMTKTLSKLGTDKNSST